MNYEDDDWQQDEQAAAPAAPAPRPHGFQSREYRPSRGRGDSSRGGGGRGRNNEGNWRERGGNNDYGAPSRRNFQQNDGNQKNITVPSHMVGRIIGKGGSKIRELEQESEAKIKIGDTDGNNTSVTLFGSDSAMTKVEDMINELLEDTRAPRPMA